MSSRVIAYVTSEVTLDRDLYFYTGGLGEVAGGIARSAYKLGKKMVGVSLLYSQGYYEQGVNDDGMTIGYKTRRYHDLMRKTGRHCTIKIGQEQPVIADIWEIPAGHYGSMPFYFLDTDSDLNNYLGRINTQQLYGGSEKTGRNLARMISQSIVLGVGAVEALRVLGYDVSCYHLNESHAVFAPLYLLHEELARGIKEEEAIACVRERTVFTNHTPVDAGNPKYDINTMSELMAFPEMNRELLQRLGGESFFDATLACLRLSRAVNAVSQKHLSTCKERWGDVVDTPWSGITNGVTTSFWQYPEFAAAYSLENIARAKALYKKYLMYYLLGRADKSFREDVLAIGWFRRFAEYKRPDLIFHDFEWITRHLKAGDFQLVMGGKPHPDDTKMVKVWNEIYAYSKELPNLVNLAGYDPAMSKVMKAGVDLWLTTPRVPLEACSTSGMSAAMNGTNLMSTPDGWFSELESEDAFLFGTQIPTAQYEQDVFDAKELRRIIDNAVIPMYYDDKTGWYEKAACMKAKAEKFYNSDRMMEEYWKFYGVDG